MVLSRNLYERPPSIRYSNVNTKSINNSSLTPNMGLDPVRRALRTSTPHVKGNAYEKYLKGPGRRIMGK